MGSLVHLNDIIDIVAHLCDQKGLKTAVSQSLKGGLITGLSSALGGMILGPVGLAIGGVIGGISTSIASANKFQSVAVIIKNMSVREKQKLYQKIINAVRKIGYSDLILLSSLILREENVQRIVLEQVQNFLMTEMNMRIM